MTPIVVVWLSMMTTPPRVTMQKQGGSPQKRSKLKPSFVAVVVRRRHDVVDEKIRRDAPARRHDRVQAKDAPRPQAQRRRETRSVSTKKRLRRQARPFCDDAQDVRERDQPEHRSGRHHVGFHEIVSRRLFSECERGDGLSVAHVQRRARQSGRGPREVLEHRRA